MTNVVGKAERKEAEVAKLQRTVVNKEGQVGLLANIIVFVLSKCIFHREAVTRSNSMERWERRERSWKQSWRDGRKPWGWRLSPQSEMISFFSIQMDFPTNTYSHFTFIPYTLCSGLV